MRQVFIIAFLPFFKYNTKHKSGGLFNKNCTFTSRIKQATGRYSSEFNTGIRDLTLILPEALNP